MICEFTRKNKGDISQLFTDPWLNNWICFPNTWKKRKPRHPLKQRFIQWEEYFITDHLKQIQAYDKTRYDKLIVEI